jgi:phage terminase small subunit
MRKGKNSMFSTAKDDSNSPPEPVWANYYSDELDLSLAREQWRSIIDEMREAQTLCRDNGNVIRRLIQHRLSADRAMRQLGEGGEVRAAKRSKVRQIDPAWTIFKQASEAASKLEAELALTPRRRTDAAKIRPKPKRPIGADEFLRPVNKSHYGSR